MKRKTRTQSSANRKQSAKSTKRESTKVKAAMTPDEHQFAIKVASITAQLVRDPVAVGFTSFEIAEHAVALVVAGRDVRSAIEAKMSTRKAAAAARAVLDIYGAEAVVASNARGMVLGARFAGFTSGFANVFPIA